MVNDGKFICKRFFANFEKLKREVESEEAFFFNDDGVYCQVGTSIFDRWEQVTLIDPECATRRPAVPSRHRGDSYPSCGGLDFRFLGRSTARDSLSLRAGTRPSMREKRVRLHRKYEAERLSQQAPKKAPKHCCRRPSRTARSPRTT